MNLPQKYTENHGKILFKNKLLYEKLTYRIIGAAREVYHILGPGYLESVYEDAMCYELDLENMSYKRQIELDVHYKAIVFKRRFRADLLVENKVLVENKAIKKLQIKMKHN
jgi:GxxExxY protein